ncbi:MAG: Gfo/Idh/MocA family oxidoreductase, partial [Crocinitomicaceae bacterium]
MKIGVIGAGQIGSRHIQGALKVREHDLEIDVVEPNQDATILSKKRNEEIESEHTVNYHQNIQDLEGKYEVVIVSTNSTNRLEITTDLLKRVDVKVLILEKVVFQSIEEFTILEENLKDRNTLVYVNHPRRMYSYYQDLKNELKQTKQTVSHIHVLGN